MKQLIIIGASGHGKVAADIATLIGYDNILFLDDDESLKKCGKYDVVGTCEKISDYNCDFFVAIGNAKIRERISNMLSDAGKNIATLIHPNAVIGSDVTIGKGSVIMAGVVINANAKIGDGCIINTSASVDHDCKIGDFAHISVGVHLAGTVFVGKYTWIGIGAVVSNNLNITDNCLIGAGAVVVNDTSSPGTYVGIPAKKKTD